MMLDCERLPLEAIASQMVAGWKQALHAALPVACHVHL